MTIRRGTTGARFRHGDGDRAAVAMFGLGLTACAPPEQRAPQPRAASERVIALPRRGRAVRTQSLVLSTRWANALNSVPRSRHVGRGGQRQAPSAATLAGSRDRELRERRPARQLDLEDEGAGRRRRAEERVRPAAKADLAETRPGSAPVLRRAATTSTMTDELWVQAAVRRARRSATSSHAALEQIAENSPETGGTAGALSVTEQRQPRRHADHRRQRLGGALRCATAPDCVDSSDGQIVPDAGQSAAADLMTGVQLARFKQRAITDGRYYPGCPTRTPATSTTLSARWSGSRAARIRRTSPTRVQYGDCVPPARNGSEVHQRRRRSRARDLALRARRHGRRQHTPRDPLHGQQLRWHVPSEPLRVATGRASARTSMHW